MATTTLGELKEQVWALLEGNTRFYTSSQLSDALYEGLTCCNILLAWYSATVPVRSIDTIANRAIYDVPDEIIFPQKVIYDGEVLEKTGLSVMANNFPTFLRDTTYTTGQQVKRWVPIGINKFSIHPVDAVGGALLEVNGIRNITEQADDDVTFVVPKEGIPVIVDYAAHIAQCGLQGLPFMQSMDLYRTYEGLVKLNKYWTSYRQPTLYFDEQVKK